MKTDDYVKKAQHRGATETTARKPIELYTSDGWHKNVSYLLILKYVY